MSWEKEVKGIEARRAEAIKLGGTEAVARQHAKGRLTIRERIDALSDAGSFREEGPIVGHGQMNEEGSLQTFTPGNYVLGTSQIDGRPCVLGGEDFTQRGGSPTSSGLRKSIYAEDLALRYRIPLIRFLEGGGGSVTGTKGKATNAPQSMGDPVFARSRFKSIADALKNVPVISAAMGPVAGLPAARLAASHFSVMVRGQSQILIAGPAVVERATGEVLTKEELGGAAIHLRSGVVDKAVDSEEELMEEIRRFLSYLPINTSEMPARSKELDDDPERADEFLIDVIPKERRKVYKMRKIIEAIVDGDSFFEMARYYGRSQITGLARLNGWPVAIWANDPHFYAGSMTADGAQKVRRFITLCNTFHLPVVALVDEPGFMIGSESEKAATIRHGVETISTVVNSTVPWVSVIVRKTFGVAAAAHFAPEAEIYAWPSAEGGALPLEGGVAVAFRREIAEAADPDAKRRELEEKLSSGRNPYTRAEAFGVHDMIDPRKTRSTLCQWLELARPVLEERILGQRRTV